MKKPLSTFFLFSVLFLVSCSNEKEEVLPAPGTGRPIFAITDFGGNNKSQVENQYDNQGRLITFQKHGEIANIIYNASGQIEGLKDEYGFIGEKREYTPNGQLQKIKRYRPYNTDIAIPNGEYSFEYNSKGQLRKMQSASSDPQNTDRHYILYTYNQKGLIASDSAFYVRDGIEAFDNSNQYLYDNKFGLGTYDMECSLVSQPYRFAELKHNVISISSQHASGNSGQVTIQYEYNKQDYPVKRSVYAESKLLSTTEFSYSYY